MGESGGLPALAIVALLLVATAAADGVPPDVAPSLSLSGEGQSPDPAGPAKLEASGESDLSTSAQLGKGVTSLAFPGSPLAPESGASRAEPLGGGAGLDVPSQSSESEEGRDPESEEALAAQGL